MGKMSKSHKPLKRARRWNKRNAKELIERKMEYEAETYSIVSGGLQLYFYIIYGPDERCRDCGAVVLTRVRPLSSGRAVPVLCLINDVKTNAVVI